MNRDGGGGGGGSGGREETEIEIEGQQIDRLINIYLTTQTTTTSDRLQ